MYAKKGDFNVSINGFEIKAVIGRGSFGKVFLVQKIDSGEVFAMKVQRKAMLLEKDRLKATILEKDILMKVNHPFLVGMNYVFQTDYKIYFVERFVPGGELYLHL